MMVRHITACSLFLMCCGNIADLVKTKQTALPTVGIQYATHHKNHGVAPEKGNEKLALLTQMVENQRQIIVAKDAAISRLQGNVTEFMKRELKLANHL